MFCHSGVVGVQFLHGAYVLCESSGDVSSCFTDGAFSTIAGNQRHRGYLRGSYLWGNGAAVGNRVFMKLSSVSDGCGDVMSSFCWRVPLSSEEDTSDEEVSLQPAPTQYTTPHPPLPPLSSRALRATTCSARRDTVTGVPHSP